ncbi:MAG: signal peptidase I [Clostridia bacterium]|nr:signal peptidase I [Clostridia bacterium]
MKYNIKDTDNRKNKINKIGLITQKVAFALIIILIYNIFLVIISNSPKVKVNLFGYKAYIITTDSMAPNINKGDIAIIKKSDKKLKIGDIITFKKNREFVTHRIIDLLDDETYITKGDNNNIQDPEQVTNEQLQGSLVLLVPYLGKIIIFMKNKFFIIYIVIIVSLICIYINQIQNKKKIRREKKRIEDEKFKNQNNNN